MKRKWIVLLLIIFLVLSHSETGADGGVHPGKHKPIGWLIIPEMSLYSTIYEVPIVDRQYDMSVVPHTIGYMSGTSWVDDRWGNVVLGAHTPGRFAGLDALPPCSRVIIVSHTNVYQFFVVQLEEDIPATDWTWLAPTPRFTLTLITCSGLGTRTIVRGEQHVDCRHF